MNSRFFIDRPIFAWVIALFIVVLGAAAITRTLRGLDPRILFAAAEKDPRVEPGGGE